MELDVGEKVDAAGVKEKPEKREEGRRFGRGCEPPTRPLG